MYYTASNTAALTGKLSEKGQRNISQYLLTVKSVLKGTLA